MRARSTRRRSGSGGPDGRRRSCHDHQQLQNDLHPTQAHSAEDQCQEQAHTREKALRPYQDEGRRPANDPREDHNGAQIAAHNGRTLQRVILRLVEKSQSWAIRQAPDRRWQTAAHPRVIGAVRSWLDRPPKRRPIGAHRHGLRRTLPPPRPRQVDPPLHPVQGARNRLGAGLDGGGVCER
jgi:hypothetical protein